MKSTSVLFVCLGNVCRSPSAEGVFRALVSDAGLSTYFAIDSAGTGGHFAGRPPDPRAQAAALARGIDLSDQRARQVVSGDFDRFDYIIAMDPENLADLRRASGGSFGAHLGLMLQAAKSAGPSAVPDPFYGGERGFEEMLDLIESGAAEWLERMRTERA